MSGLEVVALVAGIISAFSGTASFLQDRKKRKADKAEAKKTALHNLQLAVTSAPLQIQGEYDRDFGRIGSKFVSGDSIARDQLTGILISMQQSVIQTLQALLVANSPSATLDYTALLGITDSSRLDSVSALAQQYQRFSTAAPITSLTIGPTQGTAKKPQWCPGGLRWQRKTGGFWGSDASWKCLHCKVGIYTGYPEGVCKGMHWCFFHKQHIVSQGAEKRQCTICWDGFGVASKVMNHEEWLAHVEDHLKTGGLQLCRGKDGKQQYKSECGVAKCKKIHGDVQ